MIQAGHDDPLMHREFYASVNPGIDGQGTYLGNPVRSLGDTFRDLEIVFNPNQPGTLPAAELEAVMESKEYQALEEEISTKRQNGASKNEIRLLSLHQHALIDKALQKHRLIEAEAAQTHDPYHDANDEKLTPCAPVSFSRLKAVTPERRLLSDLLFQSAPLRSDIGKKALQLLVDLFMKTTETSVRQGLDRHECKHKTVARNEVHAYRCVKKHLTRLHGFAEYCFLCNEWFSGHHIWEQHCSNHISKRNLPLDMHWMRLNGCSILPGMCPDCLGDDGLPPSERFQQFVELGEWEAHLLQHDGSKTSGGLFCGHPQCKLDFDSRKDWEHHRYDIHRIQQRVTRKRKRADNGGCATTKLEIQLEIVVNTSSYFPKKKKR
ncbi:hypothetical protein CKAH01_12235 [Colletotrichum kahawae]|uniref:Uncharacterized protein n=1 Tax=Colletotrichum kahawae TaxID=34407 RepID=A0AAD9YS58_COLKA|nr:hypothetical protein CKAH01_12235 [Colletotrichum kahawae]